MSVSAKPVSDLDRGGVRFLKKIVGFLALMSEGKPGLNAER